MQYINQSGDILGIPTKEIHEYNRKGELTTDKKKILLRSEKYYKGKTLENTKYFIHTHNSSVFDPFGVESTKRNFIDFKQQEVSQQTFDYYMMYLQTKNSLYLTRAQRGLLND